MSIWALADLHLAKSVPSKNMAIFGPAWEGYMDKMEKEWKSCIDSSDLVLLPGDISWAMRLDEAVVDLEWIHSLPGTKLMIRGNHDYWWTSPKKMSEKFPSSIHFIQNTAFHWNDIAIGGSRLWDTPEYNFNAYVHFQENPNANKKKEREEVVDSGAIFERELERLRLSLKQMNPSAKLKIAMTHYPPISSDLRPSRASAILQEFGVNICVFGHLHNLKKDVKMFGEEGGVKYILTAADYIDFKPVRIL
jgi:predicted phosphohydrolase